MKIKIKIKIIMMMIILLLLTLVKQSSANFGYEVNTTTYPVCANVIYTGGITI